MQKKIKACCVIFAILFTSILYHMPVQAAKTNSIYILGDSTAAEYRGVYQGKMTLRVGWGERLQQYVKPRSTAHYVVRDYASPGKSTKTFYQMSTWKKVGKELKDGDVVIIQFGINDYALGERHTDVCGNVQHPKKDSYEWYLKKYIQLFNKKSVRVWLVSPTATLRDYSKSKKKFVSKLRIYADAMESMAEVYRENYFDLNKQMTEQYNKKGFDYVAKQYHIYDKLGGPMDSPHFVKAGADNVAKMIAVKINKYL